MARNFRAALEFLLTIPITWSPVLAFPNSSWEKARALHRRHFFHLSGNNFLSDFYTDHLTNQQNDIRYTIQGKRQSHKGYTGFLPTSLSQIETARYFGPISVDSNYDPKYDNYGEFTNKCAVSGRNLPRMKAWNRDQSHNLFPFLKLSVEQVVTRVINGTKSRKTLF